MPDKKSDDIITVSEAEDRVIKCREELEKAERALQASIERSNNYAKSQELIDKLKQTIESKDFEIEKLNKLKNVKLAKNLKKLGERIHEHLIGDESLYDDELEQFLEVLQSI